MDLIPGFSRRSLAGLAIGLTILICQTGLALAGKKASVISEDTLALHPELLAMKSTIGVLATQNLTAIFIGLNAHPSHQLLIGPGCAGNVITHVHVTKRINFAIGNA